MMAVYGECITMVGRLPVYSGSDVFSLSRKLYSCIVSGDFRI